MPWQGFPKLFRLTRRSEFDAVFATQLKATDAVSVVHARPNGLGRPRLGIVVGRRIRRAVDRNRLKRLYREAFRLHRESLADGWDFVVIPRKSAGLTIEEASASLVRLAERLATA
jgi:ribonuclease P protein component